MCNNCAKCGKGFKIGTDKADTIQIKNHVWGISKLLCFCSYANMAASDKDVSLKRKLLKMVLLKVYMKRNLRQQFYCPP